MKTRIALLVLAVPVVFLAVSCQGGGIYWTLENEVKINDLSLPNEITVFDVTKIGGTYYAAAGKIWTADDSSVGWNKDVRIVGPTTDAICKALVVSPFAPNDTLFGGFIRPEVNLGLYESGASPTPSGTTWTQIPGTGTYLDGAQVALITSVTHPTQRLAVVATKQPSAGADYEHWIVTLNSSLTVSNLALTRAAGEQLNTINDVVYSTRLGVWFATEGTKLYAGAAGPLAADTVIPSDGTLWGVFDDGSRIYVASSAGAVFWSDEASYPFITWNRVDAPLISGEHPPLTRFAGPVTADSKDYLLVGSDGFGYYHLVLPPETPALTRCPDTTDDLHAAAVLKLYYDGPKDRIFACTSKDGLWRGDKDAADPVDPLIEYDWVQE